MSIPATDEPRISLLYVDDEPALLEIARLFLERTGNYSVSTCDNPHDALKIISQDSFDAIISDYQMPECDGISFLKYLRKIGNNTPFIIFTGKGREDVVIQALNEGADFYLQKGGDPKSQFAELSNKIRYAVTRKQSEEALLLKNEELSAAEEELRSQLEEIIWIRDQLKESNEYLGNLITYANAPIIVWDQQCRITRFNDAFGRLTGISPEQAIGSHLETLFPKESRDTSMDMIRHAMAGETWDVVEIPIQHRSGEVRTVIWNSANIRDNDGEKIIATIAQGQDITERKQAEMELEHEKAFMDAIFSSVPGMVYLYDSDGKLISWNANHVLMTGYSPDELSGMQLLDWYKGDEESQAAVLEGISRTMREGFGEAEANLQKKDGTTIPMYFTACPVTIHGRQYFTGIGIDISEKKVAEEALIIKNEELQAKNKELDRYFSSSLDLLCIADISGNFVRLNPEWENVLGYTICELEGQPFLDFVHPDDLERTRAALETLGREEKILNFENRYRCKNGSYRWIEWRSIPQENMIYAAARDITERKRTEEALLAQAQELHAAYEELRSQMDETITIQRQLALSEERYRAIFEHTRAPTVIIEEDTTISLANSAFAKISGYSPEEVIGRSWTEFVSQSDLDRMTTYHRQRRDEGAEPPTQYEFTFLNRYGDTRTISVIVGMIPGTRQSVASFYDLTELKQAEAALRESEYRLSQAVSGTGAGLWDWDMINDRVFFSRQWKRMLGYEDHEIENTFSGWKSLWHPDDAARIEKTVNDYLEGRTKHYEIEHRLRHKDGSWHWILTRGDIQKDAEGRPVRWIGTNIDITEQKKQAEELENFFAVNLDLLCIADLEGNFIKTNEIWSTILGYSTEELNKRKFLEFVHPDDMQATLDTMADLGRGEDVLNFTNRYRCKDGSYRYIEWRSHPQGNVIYAAARDITERINAKEALHTANKKLHLLSGITRHDILNQIMALQGYLDLTISEIEDSTLSRYLTEAEKAADSIQRQIEFTKAYESLGVETPTWQPLSPVIEAIDDSGIPIHHDCGDFSVYADPMFEKVLNNLYDNTIRHAEGADYVRIRCEEEEGDLIIIWEDNGPGIPNDEKEQLFDKGFGKNTGLGLFLTREILSITGITISETGVYGEGARFEIRVPAGGFSGA